MKLYSLTIEGEDELITAFSTDYKKLLAHESVKNFKIIEETNTIEEDNGSLTLHYRRQSDNVDWWKKNGIKIESDCYAWIKVVNNFLG